MAVTKVVDRVAGLVSSVSTVLATLAVFWLIGSTVTHVLLRSTGRAGLAGIVEVNALVVVGVVFLGLAGAQRSGAHVSVQMLVVRLPIRGQTVLSIIGTALSAVIVTWMAWAAADAFIAARSSGERLPGVAPVPLWPAKAVAVLGLVGLLIELANSLLKQVVGARAPEAVEVPPAREV